MRRIFIAYNYMCDQKLPKIGHMVVLSGKAFYIDKILGLSWDDYGGLRVEVEGEYI